MANLVFKKADDAKAAITDSARKEIAALYSKWSDEIGKKAEYYKTKTNASSWLQEMNMRQLQAQLDATSKHIANEVNGIVKDTIYQVSDAVVQANNDWLIKLGFPVTGVESAFVSVPDQTVRRLITGQIYESGWSLSKSIWSDNEDTLKKLYEIVAQGLAQNMTAYDISKLLEQYVDPSRAKQWNLRMADGKNIYKKAVDYNAQRLARTLAQHGYQTSVIALTEKNPFILDIIWRANGSRVCELCEERDGQHFPKNDLPLDHPNGMCTMEPAVDPDLTDKLADWINSPDGTFPEIDAFASEFGYVPENKVSVQANNNEQKINNVHYVAQGKDITNIWSRRPEQFDFEIEDIINAQGFDGLPRIVSSKEFEEYVKQANDGAGFIAQRTYSAPSQEILDKYRDQLYNGKWYVDCSTGGSLYGQGMYTSSNYNGELSNTIKMDMISYKDLGESRFNKTFDAGEARERRFKMAEEKGNEIISKGGSMNDARAVYDRFMQMDEREFAEKYAPELLPQKGVSYIETMTLDSSAKIITYSELGNLKQKEISNGLARLPELALKGNLDEINKINDYAKKINDMDYGSYAALKGYDAIHAEGYTVILNRTKVIILEDK